MKENFSAVILAAGSSGRMGQPKALLPFDPQRCFARKLADDFYTFGCSRVIMVTNSEVIEKVTTANYRLDEIDIILNSNPDKGRFYSLYLALQTIENQYVFMTNVDNPFAGVDILELLGQNASQADYICPVHEGKGGHPVLLSPTIVSAIKAEIKTDVNIKDYLKRFSKFYVPVANGLIHANINTPEDYEKFIGERMD